MTQERRIQGQCKECGEPVTKIENADVPVGWVDKTKFIYPWNEDEHYCIFRCRCCSGVIHETWESTAEIPAPGALRQKVKNEVRGK